MSPVLARAVAAFLLLGNCPHLRAADEPAPGFAESTDPESAPAPGKKAKKPTLSTPVSKDLIIGTWSGTLPVPEPVGISVAPDGTVYVTQTERRKGGDLDIRDHKDWIPTDVALESIEAKAAFYHDVLAPGKNGPVPDNNKDKSKDWHDLTVPTERLWRYRDTKGAGTADERIEFASGFNTEVTGIAAGILFHQGSVYSTIAPDFWKLTDTNGDGKADVRKSLAHGFGLHIAYAGHDMHGPRVGPDGRIYWTIGDKGVHVTSQEGRLYHFPHRGCLMRCDPDGSNFEVVLTGIRNVQEIVFDEFGNMFAEDNDADKPGERERVLFLIEGADYGWQNGYQYRGKDYDPWMAEKVTGPRTAEQPAYVLPAICFGHGGPGAFAYNAGTALGAKWARTFFVGQFTGSGRINAYQLEPDGAGFKQANDRVVCEGVAAVSFAWGPDGKLFAADWEGGYDMNHVGYIRTLDVPATDADPRRTETQGLLKAGASGKKPAELVALLAHPDMRVRLDAQFALVAQKATELLARTATDAKADRFARIHSLWGLGQAARLAKAPLALPDNAVTALLADADAEIRAQMAKVCGDSECTAALPGVVALLGDTAPRVRLLAGLALGKIGQGGHVWPDHEPTAKSEEALLQPLIKLVVGNNDADVYLRQAGVFALAQNVSSAALGKLAQHPSAAVRRAAVLALRRQDSPLVSSFFADADVSVLNEAVLAYHDRNFNDPKPFAPEALAELLAKPADVLKLPVSAQRRIINANLRSPDAKSPSRLAAYAAEGSAPQDLRTESIEALLLWEKPAGLDRVTGRNTVFPMEGRSHAALTRAAAPMLPALQGDKRIAVEALRLSNALGGAGGGAAGMAMVLDAKLPVETRLAALEEGAASLEQNEKPVLNLIQDAAQPAGLRGRALVLLGEKRPAAVEPIALALLRTGLKDPQQVPLLQAACEVAGKSKTNVFDALLSTQLAGIGNGKAPASLALELIEAVTARAPSAPELKKSLTALEAYRAEAAKTAPLAAYGECFDGGNPAKGAEIFVQNLNAGCIRCHSNSNVVGALIGPNLKDIGGKRDRAYLLESLVAPGAKIADGFGLVSLTLKGGGTESGIIVKEDKSTLTLRLPDNSTKAVPVAEITARTAPVSMMPPMAGLLTRRELRDMVAYLASLKEQ